MGESTMKKLLDQARANQRHFEQAEEALLARLQAQEVAMLRFRYAEWWARNAAETNSDEGLRWTLLECALLALCCETTTDVGKRIATHLPTEPTPARALMLRSVLQELDAKKPTQLDGVTLEVTDEPWPPWEKHAVERPGRPLHNPKALAWFARELERGAYTEAMRALEMAVWVLAQANHGESLTPPIPPDKTALERLMVRRAAGQPRALPAYGAD
jgi:hypothetical protein